MAIPECAIPEMPEDQKRERDADGRATARAQGHRRYRAGVAVAGLATYGGAAGAATLLQQLAGTHQAEAAQLLASARQVTAVQRQLQRTEDGIAALHAQLATRKTALGKLLASSQATLGSLTTPQQSQVSARAVGAGGTTDWYAQTFDGAVRP